MNQFNVAFAHPSATKHSVVHVVDRDFNRLTVLPFDVRRLPDCDHDGCAAVLEVPASRLLTGGNVIDLG